MRANKLEQYDSEISACFAISNKDRLDVMLLLINMTILDSN